MKALYRAACAALSLAGAVALAQPSTAPAPSSAASAPAPQDTAAAPAPEPAASQPQPAKRSDFEGAVGLLLKYEPSFSGSSQTRVKPNLAGFLRWGRYTVTGAGGFTTREQVDVERGVDAEVLRRDNVKMNLSLRFDGGRKESESSQLSGLGDIDPTIRARLGLRWIIAPRWEFGVSSSSDILGKGGGTTVTGGLSHLVPFDARHRLILGLGSTWASARYLRTWYGVDAAQSLASGYPVYLPGSGMRDWGVTVTWRADFHHDWSGFLGASHGHLLGPAAASPIAFKRTAATFQAGLVRRF